MPLRIPDYYVGKHILITGATGLMGKALVEKLLRSCPGVEKIYVIVRSKRGTNSEERWAKVTQKPLFDILKSNDPGALSKVVVLPGDNNEANFGLSEEHQNLLKENVHIIFHGSATINFAESLIDAIKTNVVATYSLLELARQSKRIELFVHISTSYSNFARHGIIEEKVYRCHLDWRDMLELIKDEKNVELFLTLQPKLMGGHITTYTLSKGMAEDVVNDYRKYFPVQIARPALVVATMKDPFPGWIDAENFMTLLCKGVRMGVARVMLANPESKVIYTPLDMGVRAFVVGAWRHQIKPNDGTEVYCSRPEHKFDMIARDIKNLTFPLSKKYPSPDILLWYPFVIAVTNGQLYRILTFLLHVIPAAIIDSALRISGKKPKLLRVYQKLEALRELSKYYANPHNEFLNNNFLSYEQDLLEEDKKDFSMAVLGDDFSPANVININATGAMKHLWNEDIENPSKRAHDNLKRAKIIHYAFISFWVIMFGICLLRSLLAVV